VGSIVLMAVLTRGCQLLSSSFAFRRKPANPGDMVKLPWRRSWLPSKGALIFLLSAFPQHDRQRWQERREC
jgi:hypothetical protein